MNYEEIASAIEGYKEYLPEHFKDEKYKWEAVKHFQDNWDIDAEDFGAMFKKATQKAGNLLASVSSFPRGMILEFAKDDNEATRQMFRNLYDESIDLAQRIDDFVKASEDMRARYNDGTWNDAPFMENTKVFICGSDIRINTIFINMKYTVMFPKNLKVTLSRN